MRWFAFVLTLYVALAVGGCSHDQSNARRLVALLNVKQGMVAANVSAGGGRMTIMLSRRVGPKGHVFTADTDPNSLADIRYLEGGERLWNVTVVRARDHDAGLPAHCCDVIFLRDIYDRLKDPVDYDASMMRALRPGGRLAILDFRPTFPWPLRTKGEPASRPRNGVDPGVVIRQATSAGLKYVRKIDPWRDPWPRSWEVSSYCLIFEKPPRRPNHR